ncbi:MAG: hypothetical protein ABIP29_04195 [Candidatus Eisenbacteria bacterium]
MSGGLVEEFLAAAPLPLGTPVDEVEGRLGPAGRVLTRDGRATGFAYPGHGIWLAAEDGIVTSISFLTGTAASDGARFAGALPGGLTVDDPPERVLELYGPPDRIQDIPLARPPKARMILSFYDLDAPASLLVAVRSERPAHLDRLVLTRRA